MPPVKIDHIVSFSSEDPVHTANNILSTDTSKKWKCQTSGEKQAIVVLQLEKASQITAIDIGNEHSAYIEILVSRSMNSGDYKVLLVTSAFMTPLESRQSQNVNKVRMFTQDQLSKPESDEKWDRVKIICTQPFNKHVQFGLSFITLHSNENKGTSTPSSTKIGNFIIRPESPDNLSPGNLFAKRKELKQDDKPSTAAAAIRDAASFSSLTLHGSPSCKPKLIKKDPNLTPKKTSLNSEEPTRKKDPNSTPKKTSLDSEEPTRKNRNRDELFYNEDDIKGNEKIDRIMKIKEKEDSLKYMDKDKDEKQVEQKRKTLVDVDDSPRNKKKKKDDESDDKKQQKRPNLFNIQDKDEIKKNVTPHKRERDSSSNSKKTDSIKKNKNGETKENQKSKKLKITKPFNKLLDGVIFVISGIQNPERATLRSMALSMGAKYKGDWEPSCTHLICAFSNTPKFNQVKGKGKIVKRSWITDCHDERKRLPWRRYALDKSDEDLPESEDEIEELVDLPSTSRKSPIDRQMDSEHQADGSDTEERIARIIKKKKQRKTKQDPKNSDDDSDHEKTARKKRKHKNQSPTNIDLTVANTEKVDKEETITIFDADTDEEPELCLEFNNVAPDMFHGDKFYVDQTFDNEIYNTLCKYIRAYNGKCSDDITGNIDIIITTKENSSTIKEVNPIAKCVKHDWILQSHNKQKLLPIDDFVFT